MNRKGSIVSINKSSRRAIVIYQDIEMMPPEIPIASHIDVEKLSVNTDVIVAFYGNDLISGVIIGVI